MIHMATNREVTKRSSGTPYYRAVGPDIERLTGQAEYTKVAQVNAVPGAPGTPAEIAEAVAEVLDLMDLNRDKRRYTAEARLYHMASNAPGFAWVDQKA